MTMSLRTRTRDVLNRLDHPRLTAVALLGLAFVLIGFFLRSTTSVWGSRAVSIGLILVLYAVTGFVAFSLHKYVGFE